MIPETFDGVFFLTITTMLTGLCALCIRYSYRSKCKTCKVCCIKIERDIDGENKNDEVNNQHNQNQSSSIEEKV